MAFVRTYGDGTPVEVLRNRYKAPMQSEKIWMPGVIVKLMRAPSATQQGPLIQESYLISFTEDQMESLIVDISDPRRLKNRLGDQYSPRGQNEQTNPGRVDKAV